MAGNTRLLVAEDSPTQAIQIQMLLEEAGYEVELAGNGRAALEMIRLNVPDAVVTDLEMPEMNGLELVAAIQQEFKRLPVVLITARGSEEIASMALKAGAASYVPKKEMENDLVPTLKRILAVIDARRADDPLGAYISAADTEFLLDNDNSLVPFLIARLQEDLGQLELWDEGEMLQVATALDEALVNAMIHGNLEVSSELRSVDDGKPYSMLIEQRNNEPPYNSRRVLVKVKANREKAEIVIRDQGPGFNPATVPDPTDHANLDKVHGRGLLLINAFMDDVTHNATGNEIKMVKNKTKQASDA